jgi:hypothetical protein
MSNLNDPYHAVAALRRALSGVPLPKLRQASVEVDPAKRVVKVRFEYQGEPEPGVLEACQIAGTELISDYPSPWDIDEQHRAVHEPHGLSPLAHVVYSREEV